MNSQILKNSLPKHTSLISYINTVINLYIPNKIRILSKKKKKNTRRYQIIKPNLSPNNYSLLFRFIPSSIQHLLLKKLRKISGRREIVWEKCRIEEEKIWLFGPWPKRRSVVGGHEWHGVVLHTVWPPIATTLCGQREGVFFFFPMKNLCTITSYAIVSHV